MAASHWRNLRIVCPRLTIVGSQPANRRCHGRSVGERCCLRGQGLMGPVGAAAAGRERMRDARRGALLGSAADLSSKGATVAAQAQQPLQPSSAPLATTHCLGPPSRQLPSPPPPPPPTSRGASSRQLLQRAAQPACSAHVVPVAVGQHPQLVGSQRVGGAQLDSLRGAGSGQRRWGRQAAPARS